MLASLAISNATFLGDFQTLWCCTSNMELWSSPTWPHVTKKNTGKVSRLKKVVKYMMFNYFDPPLYSEPDEAESPAEYVLLLFPWAISASSTFLTTWLASSHSLANFWIKAVVELKARNHCQKITNCVQKFNFQKNSKIVKIEFKCQFYLDNLNFRAKNRDFVYVQNQQNWKFEQFLPQKFKSFSTSMLQKSQ